MKPRHVFTILCALLISFAATNAQADVKLLSLFGDHMVLQQGQSNLIWGTADAGEKVSISLDINYNGAISSFKNYKTVTADKNGNWKTYLPKSNASQKLTITVQGKNKITLKDVLVGEVWVCSGQSNMAFRLIQANNSKVEIKNSNHPKIRLFLVARKRSNKPLNDVKASWNLCTPKTSPGFSAVAYFFGRHLQKKLNVPIGLIATSWGGTPAEHWTPKSQFQKNPKLLVTTDNPRSKNVMKGRSSLFNGMIAPLTNYGIKGAIWYQGESNVPRAEHYHKLFAGMIKGWRNEWNQGDFPFLFVQIAPYNYSGNGKNKDRAFGCAMVQEAQTQTLSLKNTGMAVIWDIGNLSNIHPKNKQDVGKRLGLAAQAIAYGENVVHSGPTYRSMRVDGNKAIVQFTSIAGGLTMKGKTLTEFQVAGKDRVFHPAHAEIVDNRVVVISEQVKKPVAVRFAYHDLPKPNLFNKAGLPATPFRTDSWPVLSRQMKDSSNP